jgi:two-component system sensor histidine kinase YesM
MKNLVNFKNYSIRSQLILFLVVIILPSIAIGLMTYKYSVKIMTQVLTENRLIVLSKTAENFNQRITQIQNTAYQIANDNNIRKIVEGNFKNSSLAVKAKYEAEKSILNKTSSYNYIASIYIVPTENILKPPTVGSEFINPESTKSYQWNSFIKNKSSKTFWLPIQLNKDLKFTSKFVITYGKPITGEWLTSLILGHVVISVKGDSFNDFISEGDLEDGERVCLVDEKNQVYYRTDLEYSDNSDIAAILNLKKITDYKGNYFSKGENGEMLVTYVNTSLRDNWRLVSIMPVSSISNKLNGLTGIIFSIVIIFTLISLLLGIYVYRAITRPLNEIVTRMKNIAYGDFSAQGYNVDTRNEVEKVHNNFNWMAKRVAQLMERNIQVSTQKRDAELKALQAQINPHFLYNTLDAINWLAMLNKQDDISEMIKNLSRFFRYGLNDGKEIITIEEEIKHVEAFLDIERFRYKNRFKVSLNLDKRLFKHKTLKFILQPFVENAFIHGFKESNGEGSILIQLYSSDNIVFFEVIDDGRGMEPQMIDKVLKEKSEGYGVVNVNERIKLKYGSEYGVTISSGIGKGTVVTISIPKSEAEDGG